MYPLRTTFAFSPLILGAVQQLYNAKNCIF